MRIRKSLFLAILAVVAWGNATPAEAKAWKTYGDEDFFPVSCIDFSGHWTSDKGKNYNIEQRECKWLRIHAIFGTKDTSTTIVPDNKDRSISETDYSGVVRHRWNARNYGRMIETNRTLYFHDRTISELVILESVNQDLLLESTYRTITLTKPQKGVEPVRHEYDQQVFRRSSDNTCQ